MTANEQRISIAREQARLQNFGLSHAFAERANAAGPSGMWFPEQSELLRERVVTTIVTPPPPKPVASRAPAQSARPPGPPARARAAGDADDPIRGLRNKDRVACVAQTTSRSIQRD